MLLNASASTVTSPPPRRCLHPGLELAGVDPRRHRGHPPQRRRDARAGQVGGEQRQRQRHRAGQHERPRHAVLGPIDDRQRLAGPDDDSSLPTETARSRIRIAPTSGTRWTV